MITITPASILANPGVYLIVALFFKSREDVYDYLR